MVCNSYPLFSVFSAAFPDHLHQPLEGFPRNELWTKQRQVGPDATCHPGIGAQLLSVLASFEHCGYYDVNDRRTIRKFYSQPESSPCADALLGLH